MWEKKSGCRVRQSQCWVEVGLGVRKRQKWCVTQQAHEAEWASVRKHRL